MRAFRDYGIFDVSNPTKKPIVGGWLRKETANEIANILNKECDNFYCRLPRIYFKVLSGREMKAEEKNKTLLFLPRA